MSLDTSVSGPSSPTSCVRRPLQLMEERYMRRLCTMITTNLDYDEWYSFLGQKAMVAALLDRLRHRCVTLRIDGPSLRVPAA